MEKNTRLQNLNSITAFCSESQEKLRRSDDRSTFDHCNLSTCSKEETDEEAIEIQEKCDESAVTISNLQNQILVVRTPHRRVSLLEDRLYRMAPPVW